MTIQAHQSGDHASAASRAGSSSFYLAMRILPRDQRRAMFDIYSFCRAVDDIADSEAPRAWRRARLAEWREDIDLLCAGGRRPGLDGLADAVSRFALRRDDLLAVIDGVEMDAAADIQGPDLALLELYCDRVACAVGRLSVRVFGMDGDSGIALSHHLGQALQLTNILRDIDEDAAIGRLYLPREALSLAGINGTDPRAVTSDPGLTIACAFVADRARDHFVRSDEIMARCPRRVTRAPRIMAEVYRQKLRGMMLRGWTWPRSPVHVQKSHLLWIALRHAFV